jgi:hypothetical protein
MTESLHSDVPIKTVARVTFGADDAPTIEVEASHDSDVSHRDLSAERRKTMVAFPQSVIAMNSTERILSICGLYARSCGMWFSLSNRARRSRRSNKCSPVMLVAPRQASKEAEGWLLASWLMLWS